MQREIGSNFWLTEEEIEKKSEKSITPGLFGCNGSDYVWVSSGRSAISYIIEDIKRQNPEVVKKACVPAFTCHTVYEPFIKAGFEVKTLPVKSDLRMSVSEIMNLAREEKPGIVLIHKYFGFDTMDCEEQKFLADELHKQGIIIIEDLTQCLYSSFKHLDADYFIGSIRKWCGVPDGGFAVCKSGSFQTKPSEIDFELEATKIQASLLKKLYMAGLTNDKDTFLKKYRIAEDLIGLQKKVYQISATSYQVQTNLDIEELKRKRRDNYERLLKGIEGIVDIESVFKELRDDVVPLYFPILCEHRSNIQSLLVKNNIFAPIVWPKGEACPSVNNEANYLYDHLLCIPIDQRYDIDDMDRIVHVIKRNMI